MINKKSKRIFLSLFLLPLAFAFTSCNNSGSKPKLVINEVLVINQDNFQDDYGDKNGWIEIFNTTFKDQDLASWRIKASVAGGDTVTYRIPKGDVATAMAPRQHLLFWADGKPNRGTFHTTIVLDTLQTNWIGLYNAGDKLIDEITIPAGLLKANQSYARTEDGSAEWEVKSGNDAQKYVTPSTNNVTQDQNRKIERFEKNDKYGIIMAITAMGVVFLALLVLYLSFKYIGMSFQKKETKASTPKVENETKHVEAGKAPDEVYAAIAMALHEELGANIHDEEDEVLTITNVSKHWNQLVD